MLYEIERTEILVQAQWLAQLALLENADGRLIYELVNVFELVFACGTVVTVVIVRLSGRVLERSLQIFDLDLVESVQIFLQVLYGLEAFGADLPSLLEKHECQHTCYNLRIFIFGGLLIRKIQTTNDHVI